MLKEFKEFAMKGNVMDLAVGMVIGVAFKDIVTSLVNDIIMPPIGLLLGGIDFSNFYIALDGRTYSSLAAAREAGAAVVSYGVFINTIINFLIIAFAIFLVVKQINRLKKHEDKAPAETKPGNEEILLTEIRDLLKK